MVDVDKLIERIDMTDMLDDNMFKIEDVEILKAALKAADARMRHTNRLIANENGILLNVQLPEEHEFARMVNQSRTILERRGGNSSPQ